MRPSSILFASIALVTTVASTTAQAQPAEERRPRQGLELGVGLQVGEIQCEGDGCDDFTEAGGLNLNVSYMLSPTFGIALDLWGMTHREDDFTFSHYVNTIGVKWRPVPILTLAAGIGSAHASLEFDGGLDVSATSEDAFAVMGSVAVDLIRGRSWAFSVEGRVGAGFYGDDDDDGEADVVGRNVGIGAGFTFFGF